MSIKHILIFAIITLVIVVATVFVVLNFFIADNNVEIKEVVKESYYYSLDQMISNIKDSSSKAVIKIVIETTDEELIKQFDEQDYKLKDEINRIVRSKTKEELEGSNGQLNLNMELVVQFRKHFDNEEIIKIYFDELIIQ